MAKSTTKQQMKNWFVLDNILFGGDAKVHIKNESLYNEYISLKSAFLSNLNEYYEHINLEFKNNDKLTNKQIVIESASKLAKTSKAIAANILNRDDNKKIMTETVKIQIKKSKIKDPERIADIVTENKLKFYAIQNAFIGIPLYENNIEMIPNNDWKSGILFEAFKLQKDALIKLAYENDKELNG